MFNLKILQEIVHVVFEQAVVVKYHNQSNKLEKIF